MVPAAMVRDARDLAASSPVRPPRPPRPPPAGSNAHRDRTVASRDARSRERGGPLGSREGLAATGGGGAELCAPSSGAERPRERRDPSEA